MSEINRMERALGPNIRSISRSMNRVPGRGPPRGVTGGLLEYHCLRTPRVRIVPESGPDELQPIRRHFDHHEISWERWPEEAHGSRVEERPKSRILGIPMYRR